MVAVFAENDVLLNLVDATFLGQIDGMDVEIPLIEYIELLWESLLVVSKYLRDVSRSQWLPSEMAYPSIDRDDEQVAPFSKHEFDL